MRPKKMILVFVQMCISQLPTKTKRKKGMYMRLSSDFYTQPATLLAPKLLGKLLCRMQNGTVTRLRITETECYYGTDDTACHAHKGKTERTKVMFEAGGCAYIYLCYGMHSLLNIVTGAKDFPEAVLIRGVTGYNGPGKLTKALGIDRTLNMENLVTSGELWVEDDGAAPAYKASPRIGIGYAAEEDQQKLWRFTAT